MNQNNFKLYTYFRSSASYRVRIALHIKNMTFDSLPIDLRKNAQHDLSYTSLNPQGVVPFLTTDHLALAQSMTILEYLELHTPTPPLLPPFDHPLYWKARALAQYIACDIHPLNNLRVLQYLSQQCHLTEEQKNKWYHHWIHQGFQVLEKELSCFDTPYALWNEPTWVDLCLIPQIYNARRFNVDMHPYPRLNQINDHCLKHTAFIKASPEMQIDCDLPSA